ncbi:ATP-binding protein [Fulvivirgaceae bacterium BMA10]|uniref:ATP-binding protein n=1 Tax=Splendidivirga corallicola TaxID=3051826 RepID=A0ABT8KWZ4_9BACT|nr:ATP-binding protein [Fulvivirgaceae bacterium BMA10]
MQQKIRKLIGQGENEKLDFKRQISDPYKIARTITSFANTYGGTLLIGINDDTSIFGIDPEEEKYMLDLASNHYCEPPVQLKIEEIEDPDSSKHILIVQVEESHSKPHAVINDNGQRKFYVRQHDQCLPVGKNSINTVPKKMLLNNHHKLSKEEIKLLGFLDENGKITLKMFMKLCNISERRAKRTLIEMTQNNLIRKYDHEKEIYYSK